jgi:CheY-like chemotaxis protein
MSAPARIAVLGLKAHERAALEAFFRLALRRTPPYERVADVAQADLIVLDADDDGLRRDVIEARLVQRCVVVGERALPGAALQMPRPLNVLRLFTRIDRLRYPALMGEAPPPPPTRAAPGARPPPHAARAPAPGDGFAATEQLAVPGDMARTVVLGPQAMAAQPAAATGADAAAGTGNTAGTSQATGMNNAAGKNQAAGRNKAAGANGCAEAPAPTLAPPKLPAHERISLIGMDEAEGPAASAAAEPRPQRVLVVDADDEVMRCLTVQLEPRGYLLHAVRNAAQALEWAGARRYHHAFVHVAEDPDRRSDGSTGGPRGSGCGNDRGNDRGTDPGKCRGARLAAQLRLAAQDRGLEAPAVALFGSRQALVAALDREPAAFAQVEAVLALPLQRDELLEVVGGRARHRQAFAPTVPLSSLA